MGAALSPRAAHGRRRARVSLAESVLELSHGVGPIVALYGAVDSKVGEPRDATAVGMPVNVRHDGRCAARRVWIRDRSACGESGCVESEAFGARHVVAWVGVVDNLDTVSQPDRAQLCRRRAWTRCARARRLECARLEAVDVAVVAVIAAQLRAVVRRRQVVLWHWPPPHCGDVVEARIQRCEELCAERLALGSPAGAEPVELDTRSGGECADDGEKQHVWFG